MSVKGAKYWDRCWNPIIGCVPCSPACEHCYAKALMARFPQWRAIDGKPWFGPRETAREMPPQKGVVFCGNMTDLFGEWVTMDQRLNFLSALWHFPRKHSGPVPNDATYLFLTKRVERMCNALQQYTPCPNAFFGFTAENQECYDTRLLEWRRGKPDWVQGWLSAEPLLDQIDLGLRYIAPEDQPFEWVVVGCESGPRRRPCKVEWVERIVGECLGVGIPVFVKQLDLGGKCVTDISKFPEHLRIRQVPWGAVP